MIYKQKYMYIYIVKGGKIFPKVVVSYDLPSSRYIIQNMYMLNTNKETTLITIQHKVKR